MRVVFERDDRRRHWSHIHRDDGIVLLLPGYDRKWRVPHDLAHLVAERVLGLSDGVFGSIAAGAMFDNMSVVSGRPRYDAKRRSLAVLRANRRGLGVAEVLAGVVHHAVERHERGTLVLSARRAWGALSAEEFPFSREDLRFAYGELDELGRRWAALPAGERLALHW